MFEGDTVENAPRDRVAKEPHLERRPQERLSKEGSVRPTETSISLKTDGRHFFFAPGSWAV